MSLARGWLHRSVPSLVRLACWIALLALAFMCASVLWPSALPVILAMSLGHVIGVTAFVCYLFAVILDSRRSAPRDDAPSNAPERK